MQVEAAPEATESSLEHRQHSYRTSINQTIYIAPNDLYSALEGLYPEMLVDGRLSSLKVTHRMKRKKSCLLISFGSS